MRVLTAIPFLAVATSAGAQEGAAIRYETTLYLANTMCELWEHGRMVKEDPIVIAGVKRADTCYAVIPDDVFRSRFSFCVQSGWSIYVAEAPRTAGCEIARGIAGDQEGFMFSATLTGRGEVSCSFMCFQA